MDEIEELIFFSKALKRDAMLYEIEAFHWFLDVEIKQKRGICASEWLFLLGGLGSVW